MAIDEDRSSLRRKYRVCLDGVNSAGQVVSRVKNIVSISADKQLVDVDIKHFRYVSYMHRVCALCNYWDNS